MPKKHPFRFVVDVAGAKRELFSVRETNDGSLIIAIRTFSRNGFAADGEKMIETRATVHYSSEPGLSRLNFHYITAKGKSLKPGVHWTKAIKGSNFAFVASQYCGWLLNKSFDTSKNAGIEVLLGEIDQQEAQLKYCILVGAASTPFDDTHAIEVGMRCCQISIDKFNLVVLSEIELIQPNLFCYISRMSTINPTGLGPEQAAVMAESMSGTDSIRSTANALLQGEVATYKIIDTILSLEDRRVAHPTKSDFDLEILNNRLLEARAFIESADAMHYVTENYNLEYLVEVTKRRKPAPHNPGDFK